LIPGDNNATPGTIRWGKDEGIRKVLREESFRFIKRDFLEFGLLEARH
jgi:hypothetical protein